MHPTLVAIRCGSLLGGLLDVSLPLWTAALVGLIAGLLGGMGGRTIVSWRARSGIAELWEAVEGLSSRLSKREGKAGHEAKVAREKDPVALGMLAKLLGAPGNGAPPDREEMERRAAAHFRAKDKGE